MNFELWLRSKKDFFSWESFVSMIFESMFYLEKWNLLKFDVCEMTDSNGKILTNETYQKSKFTKNMISDPIRLISPKKDRFLRLDVERLRPKNLGFFLLISMDSSPLETQLFPEKKNLFSAPVYYTYIQITTIIKNNEKLTTKPANWNE